MQSSASIYASPARVYILLSLAAAFGIYCGLKLPIALFPNSDKPSIRTWVSYGNQTAEEFQESGRLLEQQLRGINSDSLEIEEINADYGLTGVSITTDFIWQVDSQEAKREVERVVASWSARMPKEVRDSIYSYVNRSNGGFLALSFYSEQRSLDELYGLLKPSLIGKLNSVADAERPSLWNPSHKEVRIELKPEVMAAMQLFPSSIEQALTSALSTYDGGSVYTAGKQLRVQVPRQVNSVEELAKLPIMSASGKSLHLGDVAHIDFGPRSDSTQIVKTSGVQSIILFAAPKPGGNIKKMSEDILAIVEEAKSSLPADIQYKVLVDPSLFIRSAVNNVFHEVGIGSLLAVSILFIFIGSLRNTVTAAIEIPLSLVLAFILMRLSGVSINLISLGGLALSAGMNVDASVVVMENIFRHFERFRGQDLPFAEKLRVIHEAVAEVRAPIISSTIASLVVFLPLVLTSGLSYAILGDLAKAVVFSHGFSAIVALILVPTVRLHLMRKQAQVVEQHSIFEPALRRLEQAYATLLAKFLKIAWLKWATALSLLVLLTGLVVLVLPKLPREVVGKPDSDMIWIGINGKNNAKIKQMESIVDDIERDLLKSFGDRIQYTFTQIWDANGAGILARLHKKSEMQPTWTALEKHFTNTPAVSFNISPWNPSELPIPDPPDMKIVVSGGDAARRQSIALSMRDILQTDQLFPRVYTMPELERTKFLRAVPNLDQWTLLTATQRNLNVGDLIDLSRVASEGRRIGELPINDELTNVFLQYPTGFMRSPEDVLNLPIGIGKKLVPLRSLLQFTEMDAPPPLYRINSNSEFLVYGSMNDSDKAESSNRRAKAEKLVHEFLEKRQTQLNSQQHSVKEETPTVEEPSVTISDAASDVTEAIHQLGLAVAASILLIFIVLLLQFGTVIEPLLVLAAVPLGFIGVLTSLFIFQSTLSLNSVLGVILLNGIAVNNSIILVDFIRRLVASGMPPLQAAIEAARLRLRPILITSLTTVLGMLPIALGFGEGGRILQPLGIAVSGGLWISMLLTLLLVPALQVAYLENQAKKTRL